MSNPMELNHLLQDFTGEQFQIRLLDRGFLEDIYDSRYFTRNSPPPSISDNDI